MIDEENHMTSKGLLGSKSQTKLRCTILVVGNTVLQFLAEGINKSKKGGYCV